MPGPADGGHWTRYDYFPPARAKQQAALEVCQRCPVLADCREWALSGRHLLGTIVGAIRRGVCARQAIGARKHALVMRRRQDSNCGCALSGHVGRHSLDVTSRRWVMSNTTHVSGIPGNPSQMR
jgi:hypothetical protein